jgi:chorismate mutase
MELEQIRSRLDALSWQMLLILAERLMLVKEVAHQKKVKGDGIIHAPGREAAIFDRTRDHCRILGLDSDYVLEIVSLMIAHAKDAECDVLGVNTFLDTRPKSPEELRANLLQFTEAIAADHAADYCQGSGSDAVQSHLIRERRLLEQSISGLNNTDLALDIGRATGATTAVLESYFRRIEVYDVCPHLIERVRTKKTWSDTVEFAVADLHTQIPAADATVSFAVANFGGASEIMNVLPELGRTLMSGGKAFLSFYNSDAISSLWYYPWPSTMRSHLNTYNNTLEVWYRDKVHVIRGNGMSVSVLLQECQRNGLTVEWVETYPTFLSILPRFFFGSTRFQSLVHAVAEIDDSLARQGPHRGTYLTALIGKQ